MNQDSTSNIHTFFLSAQLSNLTDTKLLVFQRLASTLRLNAKNLSKRSILTSQPLFVSSRALA